MLKLATITAMSMTLVACDADVPVVAISESSTDDPSGVPTAPLAAFACSRWGDPTNILPQLSLSPRPTSATNTERSALFALAGDAGVVEASDFGGLDLSLDYLPGPGVAALTGGGRMSIRIDGLEPKAPDIEAAHLVNNPAAGKVWAFLADTGSYRQVEGVPAGVKRSLLFFEPAVASLLSGIIRPEKRVYLDFPDAFTDQDGRAYSGYAAPENDWSIDIDAAAATSAGNIYLLTKSVAGDGSRQSSLLPTLIFRVPAAAWQSAADGSSVTAEFVGRLYMDFLAAVWIRKYETDAEKNRYVAMLPEHLRDTARKVLSAEDLTSVQTDVDAVTVTPGGGAEKTLAQVFAESGVDKTKAAYLPAFYAVVTDAAIMTGSAIVDGTPHPTETFVVQTYRGPVELKLALDSYDAAHPMPKLGEFLLRDMYHFVENPQVLYQMEALTLIPPNTTRSALLGGDAPTILYTTELPADDSSVEPALISQTCR